MQISPRGALLVLVTFALLPRPVAAGPLDDSRRAIALGEQGIALYEAGDYGAALAKLDEADTLANSPILALRAARCLVKLGRFREAIERYAKVATTPLDRYAPLPLQSAKQDAAKEREALLTHAPRLRAVVDGDATGVTFTVDGRPVGTDELAAGIIVEAGKHTVEAAKDAARASAFATASEGATAQVILHWPAAELAPPAPPAVPHATPMPSDAAPWRTVGWVGVGLGAAGLATGVVAGSIALSQHSKLQGECPNGQCPPEFSSDNNHYNTTRHLSSIGFIAGGVLTAAGVVVLLTTGHSGDLNTSTGARGESVVWRF